MYKVIGYLHKLTLPLGAVEAVVAVWFESYLNIGQGLVITYKAEAKGVSDNVTIQAIAKIMHVDFFVFSLS